MTLFTMSSLELVRRGTLGTIAPRLAEHQKPNRIQELEKTTCGQHERQKCTCGRGAPPPGTPLHRKLTALLQTPCLAGMGLALLPPQGPFPRSWPMPRIYFRSFGPQECMTNSWLMLAVTSYRSKCHVQSHDKNSPGPIGPTRDDLPPCCRCDCRLSSLLFSASDQPLEQLSHIDAATVNSFKREEKKTSDGLL